MASMHQPPVSSPLTRQRLTMLLLVAISVASTTIALVALQRQPVAPVTSAPVQSAAPSDPGRAMPDQLAAPVRDQPAALFDAYEQLRFQRLAAEQAVRAGNTEGYEIAVSGAEALQRRIADLQAARQAAMERDRALILAYEELDLQRLAAEQALRARNTEAYEIAVSGAQALERRIADLRAQR